MRCHPWLPAAPLAVAGSVIILCLAGCPNEPVDPLQLTQDTAGPGDSAAADEGTLPDAGTLDVEETADPGSPLDEGPTPDEGPPTLDIVEPDVGADDVGEETPDEGPEDIPETPDDGPASDEGPAPDEGAVPDEGPDPSELPCDPPLALDPAESFVLPFGLVTFKALGGTGEYRFEVNHNESRDIINVLTGAYLSGETQSSTDIIRLTDLGCQGEAFANVIVVEPMQVAPLAIEMDYLESFTYVVTGGSGQFTFQHKSGAEAGQVSTEGLYTAGSSDDQEVLRVTDVGTGETQDVTVSVIGGAEIIPTPLVIGIPEGASYVPDIAGGSGHFSLKAFSPSVISEGGVLHAGPPGEALVVVQDDFLQKKTLIKAVSVPALKADFPRSGDNSAQAEIAATGDIDGDGFEDVVLALWEADFAGVDSGAVYIYAGGPDGLEPEPVRIISGQERRDRFGISVQSADFDGDGLVDLAVGAYTADVGANDIGAVYIYGGVADGFFSQEPVRVLSGRFGGDQFGHSMAACDFNGDGAVDLAVAAVLGEDRDTSPQATNQGAVHVFINHPVGFLDEADMVVWGKELIDGKWEYDNDLRLGWFMAAGDVDGNGLCDLAVYSHQWRKGAGGNNDGIVFVYGGVAPSALGFGGLTVDPIRVVASQHDGDRSSNMGRHLALGDITGDGKAELLVGQWLHEKTLSGNNNHGAARIWMGGDWDLGTASEYETADSNDWLWEPGQNQDQCGWNMHAYDATGDGRNDVIVGCFNEEAEGGVTNSGAFVVFEGLEDALPDLTPVRVMSGFNGSDRFGQTTAVVGDLDADGIPDIFTFGGLVDDFGINVGRPYYVPGLPVPAPVDELPTTEHGGEAVPLDMPGTPAGASHGRGVAVVGDVNGDGFEDVVVGAPLADPVQQQVTAGQAFLYLGQADGTVAPEPAVVLSGHTGHSSGDQFGWDVAPAGDFDGDGTADFAVLARAEDRPGNWATNANYAPTEGCTGGSVNNPGAVYVYRGDPGGVVSTQPAFVYYGPQANQLMERLAGGFDADGDGFDDITIGVPSRDNGGTNNVGSFVLVHGRAADPDGKIVLICEATLEIFGLAANDALGRSVGRAGDLDGDGCDEFVGGANAEDLGQSNQGTVRVIYGWNRTNIKKSPCPKEPRMVLLHSGDTSAQAGWDVAGGLDVNGDGVPDLAVGGWDKRVNGTSFGAAWVVDGAYIASRPTTTDFTSDTKYPFADPTSLVNIRVEGTAVGERFGRGVHLMPNVHPEFGAGVVVGGPLGDLGGADRSGGARVYQWGQGGLQTVPVASLGGETYREAGMVGEAVGAGSIGNIPVLVVGGFDGSSIGLDQGSAYVLPFSLPPSP